MNGVILTKHKSATITSTVTKVSAGATEHLKICQVNNLSQTIDELKEKGFWIVGSSLENAKNYTEVDYKIPIALIVGNEEKGIRKLTASKCDFLVKIPMSWKNPITQCFRCNGNTYFSKSSAKGACNLRRLLVGKRSQTSKVSRLIYLS